MTPNPQMYYTAIADCILRGENATAQALFVEAMKCQRDATIKELGNAALRSGHKDEGGADREGDLNCVSPSHRNDP